MKYSIVQFPGAEARYSCVKPNGGLAEYHVMLRPTDISATYLQQLEAVNNALEQFAKMHVNTAIFKKRYFLSDAVNQASVLESNALTSIVGQPPLDGSKVNLWAVLSEGFEMLASGRHMSSGRHGAYTHYTYSAIAPGGDTYSETTRLFRQLCGALNAHGMTLEANCMRTWLYVRDIDTNYSMMVKARNDVFDTEGLTPSTHFIASTGIGADMVDPMAKVRLDAVAIDGVVPQQIKYINAATHLNRTIDYGVAFERATAIEFGDRTHIYVSGTASIDNQGQILHQGDVEAQCKRAVENVEALLAQANGSLADIASMIVYLRDISDYKKIERLVGELFPDTPRVIVLGPVCRPGWLIEIECIAITDKGNSAFAPF